MLDNHKIKHSINYAKLRSLEDMDEEAKIALPIFKGVPSGSPQRYSGSSQNAFNDQTHITNVKNVASLPIIHNNVPVNANHIASVKNVDKKPIVLGRNGSFDGIKSPKDRRQFVSPNGAVATGNDKNANKPYFNKQVMYKCKLS